MVVYGTATSKLVREYRDLHVTGSHRRLSNGEASQLLAVVNELRNRRILD